MVVRALLVVVLVVGACGGGSARPAPVAQKQCQAPVDLVHVPWVPPSRGERLEYEEKASYHMNADQGEKRASSHWKTRETVVQVERGVITELDVHFVEGVSSGLDGVSTTLTGITAKLGGSGHAPTYSIDDKPPSEEQEKALKGYERNDVGQAHWLLRLLTDQTYQRDVTTHHLPESARGSDPDENIDAKITLKTIDGDAATFSIVATMSKPVPILVTGTAVLDTARSRLATTDMHYKVVLDENAKKKGLFLNIDVTQRFEYPELARTVQKRDCEDLSRTTLHVAWNAPRVGETFSFVQRVAYDFTVTPSGKAPTSVSGGWSTATEERVTAVHEDVITGLDVTIIDAKFDDPTIGNVPTTKHMTIRVDGQRLVFTANGTEIDITKQPALRFLYRADVPIRYWATRLVTDRTFQLGVESHFTHELVPTIAPGRADIRVVLASIDKDIATFKLALRTTVEAGDVTLPMLARGTLTLDTKRARPLRMQLAADFEPHGDLSIDGSYTIEHEFVYPPAR